MISIKRVYIPAAAEDGQRFLVDRLWPRGVKKEALKMESWLRMLPPATTCATGMGTIRINGANSINATSTSWMPILTRHPLLEAARKGNITLLFSTKELELNNAVSLRAYLEQHLKMGA